MHRSSILSLILVLAISSVAAGCASSRSGSVYSRDEARRSLTFEEGTVLSVKEVTIEGTQSHIGTAAGAIAGGAAASGGGGSAERVALGVVGAVVGGVIGSATEELATRRTGHEIAVRLDSGRNIIVVQEADQPFQPNDRVRIIRSGAEVRVSRVE